MTDLDIKYKSVDVPSEYHSNLDSPGFAHWCRGVDAAKRQADAEAGPEFEYYSDGDADPFTYFRRYRPGAEHGEALFGQGRLWESDDITREYARSTYGYESISFEDLPEWVKNATTRD